MVKEWGSKMHIQHQNIFSELKNLASLKNVTLPETMGAAHKSQLDDLQKKQTGFDANYISFIIDLHEEAIKKYQQAANNAKSPEVKTFASKYLPELRTHLDSARIIKDKL
jgi:putative membrane protein